MKKNLLILLFMVAITTNPVAAERNEMHLRCERVKNGDIKRNTGRLPIRIPVIHQDGHTICFRAHHPEYIINIVQDGDVVFTTLIQSDAEQYELPQYLTRKLYHPVRTRRLLLLGGDRTIKQENIIIDVKILYQGNRVVRCA